RSLFTIRFDAGRSHFRLFSDLRSGPDHRSGEGTRDERHDKGDNERNRAERSTRDSKSFRLSLHESDHPEHDRSQTEDESEKRYESGQESDDAHNERGNGESLALRRSWGGG